MNKFEPGQQIPAFLRNVPWWNIGLLTQSSWAVTARLGGNPLVPTDLEQAPKRKPDCLTFLAWKTL